MLVNKETRGNAEKNAIELLRSVGLEDKKDSYPYQLSGGQQQRVLLARALCATDKILVLDEPTNGLDSKTTNQFYKLLKNLNNSGLTIIMVSHNLDKVMEYASHIVYLKDSMIFNGTKQEFESSDIMSALKVGE